MTARDQVVCLPDWRPRLDAYLASVTATRFELGVHDCALFTAGCVAAMTGTDLAAGYRQTYATYLDGLDALQGATGWDGIEVLLDAYFERVPVAMAQVGDIAMLEGPQNMPAFGLVTGEHLAVAGEQGLAYARRARASTAWRVP